MRPGFWTLQSVGWLAYGTSTFLTFLPNVAPEGQLRLLGIKGYRTLVGFVLTALLRQVLVAMARRGFPMGARLAVAAVACLLIGPLWLQVYWTGVAWATGAHAALAPGDQLRTALDYVFVVVAWTALYFGGTLWLERQKAERAALEAETRARDAELEMLRYQLNPHFLFNALNSIRALIPDDAGDARHVVNEFSELLRYTLRGSPLAPVPLGEEIAAVRRYLAVEQVRFEDQLSVEWSIDPSLEQTAVPGLLLQPLVENALRHGRTPGAPLRLRIEAKPDAGGVRVAVSNTGTLRRSTPGAGVGLENLGERLARLYPTRASVRLDEDRGWVTATVYIANEWPAFAH